MAQVTSYLAIGSNLGNRIKNIQQSLRYLRETPRLQVEKVSPIYEFPPQGGPKNQPKYLNLTVKIKTLLTPLDLLDRLKLIERELKRKNTSHWGPRTIDLDILFYDDLILVSRELSLPHPLLHKRIFVLKPLSDIASGFKHPLYKKSIKYLFKKLENENNN